MRRSVHTPARVFVVVTALWLACSAAAHADGFVVVRPRPEFPDPTQLAVRYHNVDITIRDQVGHVKIDQVFRNLNNRDVEGEYIFPIPDGAAVSDFVLYVDGKPVHAEAMDAQEALNVYKALVRESKDPALLEYAGREMFRARIYPFPAHGDRRVMLDYDHLVEREGGLYRFVYPLSTEKFSSRPLESAYVVIELEADRPIRNAYCPSHEVDIEYLGSQRLRLTWEESGTKPDRDLVLYYSLAEKAMDIRLVPYRPDTGEDGYFMLLASMGADEEIEVTPKDVVFVIDRSGSMKGVKIEQARDALAHCLQNLNPEDRFNVISFATSVDAFAERLQKVSRRTTRDALRFVESLKAAGGTNIGEALERALDVRSSSMRPAFIVFLTDGLPTQGESDPQRILAQIGERNSSRVRIFPFGVGYDVNAVLLDQLAFENAGSPSYVRPGEDLDSRVTVFFDQVANPVMTNLEIRGDGPRLRDLEPHALPDIFRGGQLVLFGRYRGSGALEVTLSGLVAGRRRSFQLSTSLPRRETRNDFVGRLWATRRVGSLLRQVRLYGEEPELADEIRSLGLQFGIVTPYTSFLVDEDQETPRDPLVTSAKGDTWGGIRQLHTGGVDPLGANRFAGDLSRTHVLDSAPAPSTLGAPQLQEATGRVAFEVSKKVETLASAKSEPESREGSGVRSIGGRGYVRAGGIWKDTKCPKDVKTTEIKVGSDAYFELLLDHPDLAQILALSDHVIFQVNGRWYESVPAT
ncbi:MAG: VWA domain-containing protein [Candidatus Eisenbacteria sp.]|nr:VWA domain-containing protein [Candidatus Eisenbacteria bacterium]